MYVAVLNCALVIFQLITAEQRPTPGDHEIAGDMSWDSDKKTFIVSPKGKTWPYGPRGVLTVQSL